VIGQAQRVALCTVSASPDFDEEQVIAMLLDPTVQEVHRR
jgi:hypothetical protein